MFETVFLLTYVVVLNVIFIMLLRESGRAHAGLDALDRSLDRLEDELRKGRG